MAYAGTTAVFEVRSTATAGNVNGGGFNPSNANFLTDGAATVATGNSPVFTSASYNFVAGDVGAWLFIKSGTNWTPGWYQIASVGANAATLSAAIGQGVQISNNRYTAQTVAGCATVASPTAATWGIDYSQQNAAQFSGSDLTGATTTCTSSSTPFTTATVGNFICFASGTGVTAGWYEIVSVSGVTATLDRSAGTTFSVVVYKTGGAISLGASGTLSDANFFLQGGNATTSGVRWFIKSGTYTIQNTTVVTTTGNAQWPATIEGYHSIRGDRPTDSTMPQLSYQSSTQFQIGASCYLYSLFFNGILSGSNTIATATPFVMIGCKVLSSASTAAVGPAANSLIENCEISNYGGSGIGVINNGNLSVINGCYIHDCNIGISTGSTATIIKNNIISGCLTEAINASASGILPPFIENNTLYGAENKLGIGINLPAGSRLASIRNNIIYGFATGISCADTQTSGIDNYNCYYNNTNDVSAATQWQKGSNDIAINPAFTSVSQVTGTGATSSASTLTDGTKNFTTAGVVAGRDYLQITAGGTSGIYGITAVGTTTLTTDIALGTHSGISYQITIGRNFLPTGAM